MGELNMRKVFYKFIIVFLIIFLLVSSYTIFPSSAVTFDCKVKTYSDSILMMNLDSDTVVFEKDVNTRRAPGGLVKIMTFIIAMEHYKDYEEKIPVKKSIISKMDEEGLTISGLEDHAGDKLSVKDILYNLLMTTGHDSALVLVDDITNGNMNEFVKLMNNKAKELKLKDTVFKNALGTDEAGQYSTCTDLLNMTRYAMTLPLFSKIVNSADYYMANDDYPIVTSNYLIDANRGGEYYYMYATGVKTTATEDAGRCLISTGLYEGYSYMIVAMHAPFDLSDENDSEWCMMEAADLYRWAFIDLQFVTQVTTDTPVCEQKVNHAWNADSVLLVPQKNLNIVLPANYSEADVAITPVNTDPISAPVKKGSVITKANVTYKGDKICSINLVAQDDVQLSPILYTTDIIKNILSSVWFLLAVGIVIILFVVYVIVSQRYNKNKKEQKRKSRR